MATYRATYSSVQNKSSVGSSGGWKGALTLPVLRGRGAVGLTELTTSGTSAVVQSGGVDWVAPDNGYVTMRADGAVWVKIAESPTAAVGDAFYLKADERVDLSVEAGDKIAVIDDS